MYLPRFRCSKKSFLIEHGERVGCVTRREMTRSLFSWGCSLACIAFLWLAILHTLPRGGIWYIRERRVAILATERRLRYWLILMDKFDLIQRLVNFHDGSLEFRQASNVGFLQLFASEMDYIWFTALVPRNSVGRIEFGDRFLEIRHNLHFSLVFAFNLFVSGSYHCVFELKLYSYWKFHHI
jgi:hypothetical protein